jgi:hypothetical protein
MDRQLLTRLARWTGCVVAAFLAAAGAATVPADAQAPSPTKVALHALHFPDSFAPQQVVAAAGRLWVLGARAPSALTGCDLWEVTPSTLATRAFALPDCPTDVSAGDGEVYLLVNVVEGDTNTRAYHVEAFDPATGLAQVLAPVVLQNVGSAVAHTDLTFGDGSLWLYGYATGTPEVVRISPVSGAVEGTIVNAPPIGGLYPAVAADAAGAWLGGGPGGTAQLDWVPANTTTARATSYAAPTANSAILWLAAHGGRVWAGVATYTQGARITSVTTRLVALSDDGSVAVRSGSEPVGLFPAVATPDGRLWGVQYARKCGGAEELLAIDPTTATSRAAGSLASPPNACDNEDGGSELAVVGRDVFVLLTGAPGTSVLYRVTT